MSQAISDTVCHALNAFLQAPTSHNRARLLEAADEYRELWIEAQASEGIPKRSVSAGRKQPTAYDRALEVMENGIRICPYGGCSARVYRYEREGPTWARRNVGRPPRCLRSEGPGQLCRLERESAFKGSSREHFPERQGNTDFRRQRSGIETWILSWLKDLR